MSQKLTILDSTLRDGAQAEGISYSVSDKLRIVKALDTIGITYIECGNPGSNPKDIEFFQKVKAIKLEHSKIAAFGSTRRPNIKAAEDQNIRSLLEADTSVVTIFGKAWDYQVKNIIKTTFKENLQMIKDTVSYLKTFQKEVIFDAEHFFDGFKSNRQYAINTLLAAQDGGADIICLCDTNGGMFPDELKEIIREVQKNITVELGIHTHNDGGMAVANSIFAMRAGCSHVQGTFIGFGERCGNANLSNIIANMQIKKQYNLIPDKNLKKLTPAARMIAEISNVHLSENMPYVGKSAFAHKAGMHIDGVLKSTVSFEHVPPETVGNVRRVLMSEVAGRSTVLREIRKIDPSITKDSAVTKAVIEKIKRLEYNGYQFEGAESALELLIRKEMGLYQPFFKLEHFKIIGEQTFGNRDFSSSAVIKINVDGKSEICAAEGDGPVNALDKALRKALLVFYPSVNSVHLSDYKVRVLDSKNATASKVRVLIESTDGSDYWTTVGVSTDIIEASWIALVDSIEYKLLKDELHKTHYEI